MTAACLCSLPVISWLAHHPLLLPSLSLSHSSEVSDAAAERDLADVTSGFQYCTPATHKPLLTCPVPCRPRLPSFCYATRLSGFHRRRQITTDRQTDWHSPSLQVLACSSPHAAAGATLKLHAPPHCIPQLNSAVCAQCPSPPVIPIDFS